MKLTTQQLDEVRAARVAGTRRASVQFTEEQRRLWQQAVNEEELAREETSRQIARIRAAAARSGFLGDLRRAIAVTRIPDAELAAAIGVEVARLAAFREGDDELSADAIERLVAALNLRLMHEIPGPAAG
jgi:transcriptional regulator with XRE-family HTH domain